jgi:L-xylulokinase
VCGGGVRSSEWTQLLADVLDIRIEVTDSNEAGARGAAMLAGVGTGQFTDFGQAAERWVHVVRSQNPRSSQAHARADRYKRYLAAVEALSGLDAPDAGHDNGDVEPDDGGLSAVARTTE